MAPPSRRCACATEQLSRLIVTISRERASHDATVLLWGSGCFPRAVASVGGKRGGVADPQGGAVGNEGAARRRRLGAGNDDAALHRCRHRQEDEHLVLAERQ